MQLEQSYKSKHLIFLQKVKGFSTLYLMYLVPSERLRKKMWDFKREGRRNSMYSFLKNTFLLILLSQPVPPKDEQFLIWSNLGCHYKSSRCSRDTAEYHVCQTWQWHCRSIGTITPDRLGKAIQISLLLPVPQGTISTAGCFMWVVLPLKLYSEKWTSIQLPS